MILTLGHCDVDPVGGSVYAGGAIRIRSLVSGKLISLLIKSTVAVYPREGSYKITARGGHFGLGVLFAIK